MRKNIILIILPLIFIPAIVFAQAQNTRTTAAYEPEVISMTTGEVHLRFDIPAPEFRKSRTGELNYYELEIPGFYPAVVPGHPNLPSWNRIIELPLGASWDIIISNVVYSDLPVPAEFSAMELMPVQPSVSKSLGEKPPFVKDQNVYSGNEWFSYGTAAVEDAGVMRDARIARLRVSPMEYNPRQRTIRYISSAEIKVVFTGTFPSDPSVWKQAVSSPFMNSSSYAINGKVFSSQSSNIPVRFLILSDTMFQSTLQPFIAWKREKGFEVIEVYKGTPGVGTTTTSMKSYLQSIYNSATPTNPAPTYLLIVGDVQQIPAFSGTTGSHITDLYYAEFTNDIYPDMYYGRFSATSTAHLQAQIEKTMLVEKYLMADPTYLQNGILVAGNDANFSAIWANGHMNYLQNLYFNSANNLTSHTYLYPASSGQTSQIIQQFNAGATIVNYSAHGNTSGWADPSFTSTTVNTLTNLGKYPTVISNACLTNTFGASQCFGEALLRASGKGAVGHIGASANTYWDEDYYFAVGLGSISLYPTFALTGAGSFDRLFHTHGEDFSEWAVTQGAMINSGNMAVTESGSSVPYYWEIYHLMGDPSLMPYLGVPSAVQPGFAPALPTGLTQITVQANPYNYVAVSYNGVLHGAGMTDINGVINLNILPFNQPATAKLVITAQNQIPYFDSILFITPTGPFVLIDSISYIDVTGNNDMVIDAGETINVDVRIKNFTSFAAGPLTATFVSTSPYITITDSVASVTGMSGLTTNILTSAFSFDVAAFVPDQHYVSGSIRVEDGTNQWITPVSFTISSPKIRISGVTITDYAGNGNGKIEPLEDFEITVRLQNMGHSTLNALDVTVEHNSIYFQLINPTMQIPLFQKGQFYDVTFPAKGLQHPIPKGSVVKITVSSAKNGYGDTLVTYKMMEIIKEDFATGDFSSFPWFHTGSSNWFVTNQNPYEGNSCMRSGAIPNQSKTEIGLDLNIVSKDSISFVYKVSSEADYDFLKFYIDGVERGRWSGQQLTWTQVKIPVDSGQRTFLWAYEKDYYYEEGQDCAWIDYIIFPPTSLYSSVDEIAKSGFSFNIYPNPTQGILNVSLDSDMPEGGSIVILAGDGRIVNRQEFTQNQQLIVIDTGGYSKGLYLILIDTPSGIRTRKFLKF